MRYRYILYGFIDFIPTLRSVTGRAGIPNSSFRRSDKTDFLSGDRSRNRTVSDAIHGRHVGGLLYRVKSDKNAIFVEITGATFTRKRLVNRNARWDSKLPVLAIVALYKLVASEPRIFSPSSNTLSTIRAGIFR